MWHGEGSGVTPGEWPRAVLATAFWLFLSVCRVVGVVGRAVHYKQFKEPPPYVLMPYRLLLSVLVLWTEMLLKIGSPAK
jgi:hypothetical protein